MLNSKRLYILTMIFIYLRFVLNKKLLEEDITKLTNAPIVGNIPHIDDISIKICQGYIWSIGFFTPSIFSTVSMTGVSAMNSKAVSAFPAFDWARVNNSMAFSCMKIFVALFVCFFFLFCIKKQF